MSQIGVDHAKRFDYVHIVIVGPFPYSVGFKYLLTCVDWLMHWPEAILLVDNKAETVADAFFSGWIARFGTQSYNELPPSVEWHGITFSPSAKSRHYGTRITKPMDNYVASSITRHPICRKRTFGQIGCRDRLRHNT